MAAAFLGPSFFDGWSFPKRPLPVAMTRPYHPWETDFVLFPRPEDTWISLNLGSYKPGFKVRITRFAVLCGCQAGAAQWQLADGEGTESEILCKKCLVKEVREIRGALAAIVRLRLAEAALALGESIMAREHGELVKEHPMELEPFSDHDEDVSLIGWDEEAEKSRPRTLAELQAYRPAPLETRSWSVDQRAPAVPEQVGHDRSTEDEKLSEKVVTKKHGEKFRRRVDGLVEFGVRDADGKEIVTRRICGKWAKVVAALLL